MKSVTTRFILASLAAALAWLPGRARAEPHAVAGVSVELTPVQTAQFIFDTAVYLMRERKFSLACMLFERSYGIDPAIGTQFYLADCYEQTGRLVQAWSTFRAVVDAARRQNRPDRESVARRRALALIPRMGKIVFALPRGELSSMSVTVDDAPVAKEMQGEGAEILQVVNPGEHRIAVSGGGRVWWRQTVQVDTGELVRIVIPDPPPAQTSLNAQPPVRSVSGRKGSPYFLLDPKNPYQ